MNEEIEKALINRVEYNPGTGKMSWRNGRRLGWVDNGYIRFEIMGKAIRVHRAAWFITHGYWPKEIDHINHNRADNRLCNLREVDHIENGKNKGGNKRSKTGIMGVSLRRKTGNWWAYIRVNRKLQILGEYKDFFEACCIRKAAENKNGFHPNHGIANPRTVVEIKPI